MKESKSERLFEFLNLVRFEVKNFGFFRNMN